MGKQISREHPFTHLSAKQRLATEIFLKHVGDPREADEEYLRNLANFSEAAANVFFNAYNEKQGGGE